MRKFNNRAFTFIELLVVVALIVMMGAIVAPKFLGSQKAVQEKLVLTKASTLDMAKMSYQREKGAMDAIHEWSAQSSDEARYQLLKSYVYEAPVSLQDYTPAGYQYVFYELTDATGVVRLSDGAVLVGNEKIIQAPKKEESKGP